MPGARCAAIPIMYALMTRIPVILAEGTVVALTWRKTWVGTRRASLVGASNVAACLLRDGTLYFLVMMALQAVQIVILFRPTIASLGAFLDIIPPILVGRFIMHLSRLSRPSGAQAYETTSSAAYPLTSALPFSSSAGAPATSVWLTELGADIDELGADLEHGVLCLGGHSEQSVEGETTEEGASTGEDLKPVDSRAAGKDVERGATYLPPTQRYFPTPTTPSTPSTSYEPKPRTA
ncbi:hypothetical protein PsYK624_154420 [Phanerochaete sordida]|uniref:Uncharacterized protein n=1 Tax=Phanerochaete sordida TaxID=48140 RepID=A0A9P3LL09_9APHY|nr:hypothetical protein PsYK624_154420 [Phanerochaete sordida]